MTGLFRFLASNAGRVTRAVAGVVLILVGLLVVKSTAGWVIAVIGLAPLAAGVFDVCIFAPLFRLPFIGESLRKAVK
jgi:hypothetical protein